MCRLYAFRSTEATKVECTLVHAQNALITQSKGDLSGLTHSHGWGVVTYQDHHPQLEKQAWAAYHGEHFERAVARIYSSSVIAHVRRATVGGAALENTHPFIHGNWTFAHNGTVPNFSSVKPRILAAMSPQHRNSIQGETDSEHVFRYALTLIDNHAELALSSIVRKVVLDVAQWAADVDPDASVGLNIILSDGEDMSGSRWGRTLYSVERTGVYDCEICGFPHIHHNPDRSHQAVVIASEPITREDWVEIPERSVWEVGRDSRLSINSLDNR